MKDLFGHDPEAAKGHERKEQGQLRVEGNNQVWINRAREAAAAYARFHGTVTSDDLYDICPPPEEAHPNVMGAVFRHGFRRKGFVKTQRKDGHSRMISVWELK